MKAALPLIIVNLLFGCLPARALDPSLDVSQYAHTAWTTQEGSLRAGVRTIAQSPDGYLWLGTEFGLLRFDGVQFVSWNPPQGQHIPSTNIRSVLAARDGTLWIGTLEGLASWKDGRVTEYPELAQQNVLTLLEDSNGTVWAGTFGTPKGKLCAIQREAVKCYGDDGSLGEWVWSLYEDSEHRLWVGSETGLWRWRPGPAKRYPLPHAIETSQALAEGENGTGLLAVGEHIWQLRNEGAVEYRFTVPPGRVMPVNLFRDHDGGLWIGTLQRGLLHVQQERTSTFAQSDGLSSDHVLSMFEDREGNIWVGTMDGLDRFRDTSVVSISQKQGLSSASVESVLVARDNTVWLSTLDGLNRWNNGRVTIYWPGDRNPKQRAELTATGQTRSVYGSSGKAVVTEIDDPGLPDNTVGSLYEDERGRIWVSAPKGIARFENGRFSVVKELPGGWVNAITSDTHGGVWISYQDLGLLHWVDGKLVETVPWSRLGGNVIVSSVIPDPVRGGLWLGFFQGELAFFKDGQIRASYGKNEGLGKGRIMGLTLDRDGTVWASTEGGLSRLRNGKIATLTSSNGLPCDTIHWAVELNGTFWMYTACGLLRVARSELENWAANPSRSIQFTRLGRSDGVRIRALLTGYTPRVSESANGQLWFANLEAVSVINPRHLVLNKTAPPVHIERIIADSKTYDPLAGLRLPARVHDLTIDYTALSFAAPEKVRFRFKLEGQDKDWREAVNDREVQYSNLPPKHYRFRVLACNNSGVWNDEGAALDFVIPPMWYQTNWFYAACVAAFFAMGWGIYEIRVRQLAAQFNMRLEERVNERTRIARDLHDTLLQSFHGLLLRFQTVFQLLPERPVEAREKLESAIEAAADAITEGRDAVQELRSSVIQSNDLALAISTLGEELTTDSTNHRPAFRVSVQGKSRNLHPILRDETYKIAAEALRNAFRHAQAQQIEVEIHYDHEQFRLRVRDDGKGIDPAILSTQGTDRHFGLRGMPERATLIGGKLEVWTEVGAGTEVELRVPASRAYATTQKPSWLSRKFAAKT
jgi:signal transduction histidine kinase/ligand-binding sensor domain-containing protein